MNENVFQFGPYYSSFFALCCGPRKEKKERLDKCQIES